MQKELPHSNGGQLHLFRTLLPILFGLANCGGDLVVKLHVDDSAISGGVSTIEVSTFRGGILDKKMSYPRDQQDIELSFPGDVTGTAEFKLFGLTALGCKNSTGDISVALSHGINESIERTVQLANLESLLCSLTVITDDGKGNIGSTPAGIQCSETHPTDCTAELPAGQVVLTASGGDRSYTKWNSGCVANSGGCTVQLAAPAVVHVSFAPRNCSASGWCAWHPLEPTDTKESLLAVWRSVNKVYAAGAAGTLLSCDVSSGSCTPLVTEVKSDLSAVWGSDDENVYAVGVGGTVIRCNGLTGTCKKLSTGTMSLLRSVWGSDASNVYVAGLDGSILRCGKDSISCQKLTGATLDLSAIWGSDASNVYIAGFNGTMVRCSANSTMCKPLATTTANALSAVWGSDANNVYAVGLSGTVVRCAANSASCSVLTSNTGGALRAVFGIDAEHVYAVGQGGTAVRCAASSNTCIVLTSNLAANLWAIGGSPSTTDCFIMGQQGALARCGFGVSCTKIDSQWKSTLWAASSRDARGIFAVGDDATIIRYVP